ncbi:MAG: response regulator [Spirochaetes bacterium]|nr:response regulator [Spirochaetota bacterium]
MFPDLDKFAKDFKTNGLKKDGSKIKVLLVDDAIAFRRLVKRLMEGVGYEIIGEVGDGTAAVAQYTQLLPDLVTMDITMHEMSGTTAVDAIRRNHPDARIVMVTSLGNKDLVQKCIKLGAKGYVLKPIADDQIPKILETLKKAAVED